MIGLELKAQNSMVGKFRVRHRNLGDIVLPVSLLTAEGVAESLSKGGWLLFLHSPADVGSLLVQRRS